MRRPPACSRSSPCSPIRTPRSSSRRENDLFAVVDLVQEHVEAARSLAEREAMGDDEAGVDLSAFDALQKGAQVAVDVALPGAEGERAIDDRAHGKLVDEPAVH